MNWKKQIVNKTRNQPHPQITQPGGIEVDGISGIPLETTVAQRFRLTVEVERVHERETKGGDPCYFLSCRDAEEMTFSVVVWDSQWSRIQGLVEEGSKVTLDVRVPREGYSAFTLA